MKTFSFVAVAILPLALGAGSIIDRLGVSQEYFAANLAETLARRERWVAASEASKPKLHHREIKPVGLIRAEKDAKGFQGLKSVPVGGIDKLIGRHLRKDDVYYLDFGEHLVGRLRLAIRDSYGPNDAPLRLKLVMAEVPNEMIEELPKEWKGLSRAWFQDEIVNLDFTPMVYDLPRRYAFRYLKIEVLSANNVRFSDISAIAETSADESRLLKWKAPDAEAEKIDRVALNTLRDCMQTMLEDGPKRDRRLWLGDLRLQALSNYVSYRNMDIVRRSIYLLAGTATDKDGRVSTDAYEQPFPKRGGCAILDYTALFPTVVLEFLEASGERKVAEDLWPACVQQMALVLGAVGSDGFMLPKNKWWNLIDHGQPEPLAAEQGVIVYGLKRFCELAARLGREKEVEWARKAAEMMTGAARERMWKEDRGIFVSPWRERASEMTQAWMVISGIAEGDRRQRCLKAVMASNDVDRHISPYGYHYFIEALYAAGLADEAEKRLREYWGGMVKKGADTFWECFVPGNDFANSCGNHLVASYCHAWSCTPLYFFRRGR